MESLNPESDLRTPEELYSTASFEGSFLNENNMENALFEIKNGTPLVLNNGTVWALWGDASNERFVRTVCEIKGRESGRAFGLTVPFEQLAPYADLDSLHPIDRSLFSQSGNADLKNLLGAISFIRFPGDAGKVSASDIPDCVKSYDPLTKQPILQTYDPTGKDNTAHLVKLMQLKGMRYASASSLNFSREDEIIDVSEALAFAHNFGHNLPVLQDEKQQERRTKGWGSYSILLFDKNGKSFTREGSIGNDIIQQIMIEYGEIKYSPTYKPAAYPDKVLHLEDLPEDIRSFQGADLSEAIRIYLGWHTPEL